MWVAAVIFIAGFGRVSSAASPGDGRSFLIDECESVCVDDDACNGSLQCIDGSRIRNCRSWTDEQTGNSCEASFASERQFTPTSFEVGWRPNEAVAGTYQSKTASEMSELRTEDHLDRLQRIHADRTLDSIKGDRRR